MGVMRSWVCASRSAAVDRMRNQSRDATVVLAPQLRRLPRAWPVCRRMIVLSTRPACQGVERLSVSDLHPFKAHAAGQTDAGSADYVSSLS
jgi:hypothetical protein